MIVDDASTDATAQILESLADPRFRVVTDRVNQGKGAALRTGFASAMETIYRIFRHELIQSIPIQENRFGFEPEITVKIAKSGARIHEVGISYAGRSYAEGKKIGWKDGVSAMRCLVKYSWRERR